MAVAFVDATVDHEVGTEQTIAVTYTAGNAFVIGINYALEPRTASITDTQGNTYTEIGSAEGTGAAFSSLHQFVAKNLIGSSATITITYSGSVQAATNVTEWSGVDNTTPTGGTASATNTSSADQDIVSGSLSAAGVAGDAVVAVGGNYYDSASWAAGATNPSGFAVEATATGDGGGDGTGMIAMGYAVLGAGYSGAASLNPSGNTYGNIKVVVLKAAAGGGIDAGTLGLAGTAMLMGRAILMPDEL